MEKNDFLKLKPMLLQEVFAPFDDNDYIFEIKFDGIRALIFIDNGKIIIKSRRGIILNDVYPELLDIKSISKDACIFDGEIVLLDDGFPSFSKLQERVRLKNKQRIKYLSENNPVIFVCFDILYKNKDLIKLQLMDRKKILNEFKDSNVFIKTKYYEECGNKLFYVVKKENMEGIIAKKKNSLYTYGIRTYDWLKIKNFKEDIFYICGYIKNKNTTISIILAEKKNKDYLFVGKTVMGIKNSLYDKVLKEKKIKNYLLNLDDINITYISPKYKLKISYMEKTSNNMLRQPFIKYD